MYHNTYILYCKRTMSCNISCVMYEVLLCTKCYAVYFTKIYIYIHVQCSVYNLYAWVCSIRPII